MRLTRSNIALGFLIITSVFCIVVLSAFTTLLFMETYSQPQIIGLDLSEYEYTNDRDIPVSEDNLLVFAVKVNNISFVLNRAVKRSSLDLPPIELADINRSCIETNSWLYVDASIIVIFLCDDISSKLTKDEVMAYSVHEIGHIYLGHVSRDLAFERIHIRDIDEEKEADNFVVESGISPEVLISAINKLAPEGKEKEERISQLSVLLIDD